MTFLISSTLLKIISGTILSINFVLKIYISLYYILMKLYIKYYNKNIKHINILHLLLTVFQMEPTLLDNPI